MRHLPKSVTARAGVVILLFMTAVALLAPFITVYDPFDVLPSRSLQRPSAAHWFGTDRLGMDIFTRVVFAARVDLVIVTIASLTALAIGAPLGWVAGYFGGAIDNIMMRILDSFQSLPQLIIALAVVAAAGDSVPILVSVIAALNVPPFVRLARAESLSMRRRSFVEAAQASGVSTRGLLWGHVARNSTTSVLVQLPTTAGWTLIVVSSLSFLGVGLKHPTPEWGVMVRQGASHVVSGEWWVAFFPGAAIALTVLGFVLVAEGRARVSRGS